MRHKILKYLAISLPILMLSIGVQANPIYLTDEARNDGYGPNPGGYAINLAGIGQFENVDTAELFFEEDLGSQSASLTGTVMERGNPDHLFQVNLTFTGFIGSLQTTGTPPPLGSPKKELHHQAYVEAGGPIDPDGWHYYTDMVGSLTGITEDNMSNGATISVLKQGKAFQIGFGANGLNTSFGLSGRLTYEVAIAADATYSGDIINNQTGFGVVRLDLQSVPEPLSLALLALGLFGIGASRLLTR